MSMYVNTTCRRGEASKKGVQGHTVYRTGWLVARVDRLLCGMRC